MNLPAAYAQYKELYNKATAPGGIVGMTEVVDFLFLSLIAGGHCLLTGNPGLGKTYACNLVARLWNLDFKRVQFVPDIMPSDILISQIFDENPATHEPMIKQIPGPIFTNLLLADEINRAPAKVQSALLEAMQEGQVSTPSRATRIIRTEAEADALETYAKAVAEGGIAPFFEHKKEWLVQDDDGVRRWPQSLSVLATRNPWEMEGTYQLGEASLDRFLAELFVSYPTEEQMKNIQFQQAGVRAPRPPTQLELKPEDMLNATILGLQDEKKRKVYLQLKAVLFMATLRMELLGPEAMAKFASSPLATTIREIVAFTHLRSASADDGGADWSAEAGDSKAADESRAAQTKLRAWSWSQDTEKKRIAETLLRVTSSERYPSVLSGAGPRAVIMLTRAVLVRAFMEGRAGYPEIEDLIYVLKPVLRHRIRLTPSAQAANRTTDQVVEELITAFFPSRR